MNMNRITFAVTALFFAMALAPIPAGAEFRMEPGIGVSEEYNDNIFLSPDQPMTDYVTRVMPSIHMVYNAPVWTWDLAYGYDYRYYAYKSREHDSTHALTLTNHTGIVRDRLFFDVRDEYRRVSLDTVRDYTQQSLFVNQTDSNDLNVSPYFTYALTTHTSGTTGYQYRNLWYREPGAVDKSSHSVFTDLVDELSQRFALTGGFRGTRESSRTFTYEKFDVYAGPRYEYADGSTLWVILGNSWILPEHGDTETQGYWDAGISHQFLTYRLILNAALTYIDDPVRMVRRQDRYTATFLKTTERWNLSATAGRWEFRDLLTKRLQSTRNGLGGTLGYTFTEAFRTTYSLSIDRYEDNVLRTYSMLYLNTLRLEYRFPAEMTVALDYRVEHGYSPDAVNYLLNYDNNRVALEIRKTF